MKFKKPPITILAIGIFGFALAIRLYVLLQGNLMLDDFFIILRVAKNFASGNGLVYNLNEFIYPVTSIPYTLICAGFISLFDERAVFIIRLFGGIVDSINAVVLFLLILKILQPEKQHAGKNVIIIGLFGSLSYSAISTVSLISVQGMETSIYILSIALVYTFYAYSYHRTAMLTASLAAMIRPEGVLVFISLIIADLLISKKIKYKSVLFFIIPYLIYLLLLYLYYGTIIPQPVIAKSMVEFNRSEEWLIFLNKFFISPQSLLTGFLFLIGTFYVIRNKLSTTVILWALLYAALFSSLTKWWAWYFPPFAFAYLLVVSLGLNQLFIWLQSKKRVLLITRVLSLLFPVVLLISSVQKCNENSKYVEPYIKQTDAIANWLGANLKYKEKVMLEPLGRIGYAAFNNSFADYPGLISREVTNAASKLNRKIYGSPVDVEAANKIIKVVKPTALVLRENEFNLLTEKDYISNYKLKFKIYIDTTEIKKNFITQDMFILVSKTNK